MMLPTLDPAETLYSWSSRANLLLGCSVGSFSTRYFADVRASRAHDIPIGIARLHHLTGGLLGDQRSLVARHSALAGTLPYLEEPRRSSIVDSVLAGKRSLAALQMGLRASKLPGTFPLRFCSACVKIDQGELGVGCWRVIHQLPAVWVCMDHRVPLLEHRATSRGWQLPTDLDGAEPIDLNFCSSFEAIQATAAISTAAFQAVGVSLDSVRRAAIERLCHIGLVSNPSRLPGKQLHKAFLASAIGRAVSGFEPVQALTASELWLTDVLRGRVSSHPIKWALIWAWIWSDEGVLASSRSFLEAARGEGPVRLPSAQLELPLENSDQAERICVERVIQAMEHSSSHAEIARTTDSSERDVKRWFRRYPALRERWTFRVHQLRRLEKLSRIESTVEAERPASRKALIAACRADISWLRRYDAVAAEKLLTGIPADRSPQLPLWRESAEPNAVQIFRESQARSFYQANRDTPGSRSCDAPLLEPWPRR
jgi:hypothetical protein